MSKKSNIYYNGKWINIKKTKKSIYAGKFILNGENEHIFDGNWNGYWNKEKNKYTGDFNGKCIINGYTINDCYYQGEWEGEWNEINSEFKGDFYKNKEIDNILLNKNLLKNIMDEAHRFAISYHKKLRKKSFID